LKVIDFEAHFYSQEFFEFLHEHKGYPHYSKDERTNSRRIWYASNVSVKHGDILVNKLLDLGENRIKEMDAAGVDIQVISLSEPSVELFEPKTGTTLARSTNDALAEAIRNYPDRFMGFAALAAQDPDEAVKELERAVKELGFKGWLSRSSQCANLYPPFVSGDYPVARLWICPGRSALRVPI
jgi:predicted TIM-barrel fold metal-dependent hydrolase